MRNAPGREVFGSRLAAQWAVFFAHTGADYEYRPRTFTLESGTRYTPDFYVSGLGWIALSENPSMYEPPESESADERAAGERVCASFADFFEFASASDEWCYWLGGPIPFWSLREIRALVSLTLDDLEDPAWFHRSEQMREEWPNSYRWFKLRRHGGPHRLPQSANQCGGLLTRLRGANFKDWILDSEAFSAFDHKAALIAARSVHL